MSQILRTARALVSILAPLTGERASGSVLLHATGGDIELDGRRPVYGVPIRKGALDFDAVIKTVGNAHITGGGTSVVVEALVGGPHANLPAGTEIRWDDAPAGVEPVSVLEAPGTTGGVAPAFVGGVRQIVLHEELGPADVARDLFAAKVGRFPALVLTWDSSVPAGDATTRKGRGVRLFEERWLLSVVASRNDSADARRAEALTILEHARELLTDRNETEDHEIFTAPTGVMVSSCRRLAIAPTSFVYVIALSTTGTLVHREWREIAPWLRTRIDIETHPAPGAPLVTNNLVEMPQ